MGVTTEIWASATPYLVRSASRAAADLADDSVLGRQRWVGTVNGEVAGTGTGRRAGHGEVMIGVEVRPDLGSRGVGRALLAEVLAAFADATELVAVCNDDPISMSFAVRHNFLPVGEHQIAFVEPATVTAAGPAPEGLTGLPLDTLHVMAGVMLQLIAAALLRTSLADPRPWIIVLLLQALNEAILRAAARHVPRCPSFPQCHTCLAL